MTSAQFKATLDKLSITQLQCSELLGVSYVTVRRWSCGMSPVPEPAARLLKLIEANSWDAAMLTIFFTEQS
jgi:DNA-binding transcriptional regulator YiaG